MQKSITLLLLLSLAVLAGERKIVQFRLKKDPASRLKVYCLEAHEEGMEIERIGSRKKETISWGDIVDADANRLRIAFKLDFTEDEKKGLIRGQEVFFRGGVSVRGIVEKKDEDNNVVLSGIVVLKLGDAPTLVLRNVPSPKGDEEDAKVAASDP